MARQVERQHRMPVTVAGGVSVRHLPVVFLAPHGDLLSNVITGIRVLCMAAEYGGASILFYTYSILSVSLEQWKALRG
jgi:hypothetical protein